MDFLRDPIWTFVGVVAAVLIGFGGIWVTMWLRNRKALSYEVVSAFPIVTVNHAAKTLTEAIEIRYHGMPVKDVQLVVVRIWNSGNVAIAPDDYVKTGNYVRSIEVSFGGQVLAAGVVSTVPPMDPNELLMPGGTGPDTTSVKFQPILLNPKDTITLTALVTNYTGKVEVTGRIVGVSAIRKGVSGQWSLNTRVFVATFVTLWLFTIFTVLPQGVTTRSVVVSLVFALLSTSVFMLYLFLPGIIRTRMRK